MDANCNIDLKQPFLLDGNSTSRLHKLLRDKVGSVSITAKCADDIERQFEDLEGLLAYGNARNRRIVSLSLKATGSDRTKSAGVYFNKYFSGPMNLSIQGTEEFVSGLRAELSEVLDGITPWYWPFAKIDPAGLTIALCVFVFAFAGLFSDNKAKPAISLGTGLLVVGLVGVVGCVWALCMWLLYRFWKRFFPRSVFTSGTR